MDSSRGIGYKNKIQWRVPEDMAHFYKTTVGMGNNAVVMGRKTWESIPEDVRPLRSRLNVVLTRSADVKDALNFDSIDSCFRGLSKNFKHLEEVFIIGGSEIYEQFLMTPLVTTIYVTKIHSETDFKSDCYFPDVQDFVLVSTSSTMNSMTPGITYSFATFTRENADEHQYLDLCNRILQTGLSRDDRTGTGTLSLFGCSMRFSLKNNTIPLFTTKRVFWRGIVAELLYFISGSTDTKILSDQGVNIWKGNTSREFLDSRGLTNYDVGEMGPMYGFLWRHWGVKYEGCSSDYSGCGIDQLKNCIAMIKDDPTSRRIVMSAWDPSSLDKGVLPPCHYAIQFACYDTELSMIVTMRSLDMGCGFPFNVASYSLLLHMVAQVTLKTASEIVFNTGDTHIYINHVDGIREQMSRDPRMFPKVSLNKDIMDIDEFSSRDIDLVDYYPHGSIKLEMAI